MRHAKEVVGRSVPVGSRRRQMVQLVALVAMLVPLVLIGTASAALNYGTAVSKDCV